MLFEGRTILLSSKLTATKIEKTKQAIALRNLVLRWAKLLLYFLQLSSHKITIPRSVMKKEKTLNSSCTDDNFEKPSVNQVTNKVFDLRRAHTNVNKHRKKGFSIIKANKQLKFMKHWSINKSQTINLWYFANFVRRATFALPVTAMKQTPPIESKLLTSYSSCYCERFRHDYLTYVIGFHRFAYRCVIDWAAWGPRAAGWT